MLFRCMAQPRWNSESPSPPNPLSLLGRGRGGWGVRGKTSSLPHAIDARRTVGPVAFLHPGTASALIVVELTAAQFGIPTVAGQQRSMVAGLDHAALVHHIDH